MAASAKVESQEHQETVFANYLEQAYRHGISDAAVEKLEDLKMPIVEVDRATLQKLYPPKQMIRKRLKGSDAS